MVKERQLIPFFDSAYLGFGAGIEKDAYAIRLFARAGIPALVSTSFSKNFSLYGERIGALSVLCGSEAEATRVHGQLKAVIRSTYSSPPRLGAELVAKVLADPQLKSIWIEEVDVMRAQIVEVRAGLRDALEEKRPDYDFSFLVQQRGMFSYTDLTAQQVTHLKEDHGVYLISNGRLCLAGLTAQNISRVADVIAKYL